MRFCDEQVHHTVPKRRTISSDHDKARETFFEKVLAVLQRLDLNALECIVVAGPGFTKVRKETCCSFLNK